MWLAYLVAKIRGRLQTVVLVADLVVKVRSRLKTVVWITDLVANVSSRLRTVMWVMDLVPKVRSVAHIMLDPRTCSHTRSKAGGKQLSDFGFNVFRIEGFSR